MESGAIPPQPGREDVDALLSLAQHVLVSGSLDPMSQASVEARVKMMLAELDRPEPRLDLVRTWGRGVRDLLITVAHPTVRAALEALPWP